MCEHVETQGQVHFTLLAPKIMNNIWPRVGEELFTEMRNFTCENKTDIVYISVLYYD